MYSILERQMRDEHAEPRAIDYGAWRARACAERQQARQAAVRSVARYFKRTGLLIRAATAIAVVAGAILLAFGPASAKPITPASCEKKYNSCINRCHAKYDLKSLGSKAWVDKTHACVMRTCSKQFDNCLANTTTPGGDGGGKLETPTAGSTPRPGQASGADIVGNKPLPNPLPSTTNNSVLFGTGILDGGNGMGGNGPSATGSPAGGGMPKAPPAAPPVILR